MNGFISYAHLFDSLIERVLRCSQIHAKWLNTLSYLENAGARQIAKCEHPTLVKTEMLKHAAEEFRHAYYLKRQMAKLDVPFPEDYSLTSILGGTKTWHYLKTLDTSICRYLLDIGCTKENVKEAAYLLTTYAIEKRASELYPLYENHLRELDCNITVKSILLEEKGHLHEMEEALSQFPNGLINASRACKIESAICIEWIHQIHF